MHDAISAALYYIFSKKYDQNDPPQSFKTSTVFQMFFKYKKDEIIFHQNEPLKYFYILLKGRAVIVNSLSGENGNIFHTLMPLDIMGLPDYLGNSPVYTSYVIAKTNCVIFRIPQQTFISLITSDPILCYSTLRIVGQITNNSLRANEITCIYHPRKRLGYYLYLTAQENLPYSCQYTREELSDILGINLRSLHRYLAGMEKEGCLELWKGKIRINEEHYLKLQELYVFSNDV